MPRSLFRSRVEYTINQHSNQLLIEGNLWGIGYGLSNLNYDSCRRNISLNSTTKFPVLQKELCHSIFIAIEIKLEYMLFASF